MGASWVNGDGCASRVSHDEEKGCTTRECTESVVSVAYSMPRLPKRRFAFLLYCIQPHTPRPASRRVHMRASGAGEESGSPLPTASPSPSPSGLAISMHLPRRVQTVYAPLCSLTTHKEFQAFIHYTAIMDEQPIPKCACEECECPCETYLGICLLVRILSLLLFASD